MNLSMNYNGNKGFRLLNLYERLSRGEVINKESLAQSFGVSQKTIQRDIEDLRAYLSEAHSDEGEVSIKYDKKKEGYNLDGLEREWLTNKEVLGIIKILLESRAFCKEEIDTLIKKLMGQVVPSSKKNVENIIRKEHFNYIPLQHGKNLIDVIWSLATFINRNEIISFSYKRQDQTIKNHTVKPLSIMFSDFYFYLIACKENHTDKPIIFRVDRIDSLSGENERFKFNFNEEFNEGEFRKRIQFMYSGELQTVKFAYNGSSIEAVLDRLPTAKIIEEENGIYIVEAEVYGNGIDMWLRSQGNRVKRL